VSRPTVTPLPGGPRRLMPDAGPIVCGVSSDAPAVVKAMWLPPAADGDGEPLAGRKHRNRARYRQRGKQQRQEAA
jgi:hypothetical protein